MQLPIWPCVQVYSVPVFSKSLCEEYGEENTKENTTQCRGKNTDLFHCTLYLKAVRCNVIKLHSAVHVVMNGKDEVEKVWETTNFLQDLMEPHSADSFKCLDEINKIKLEWCVLFPAFLLKLAEGKDHTHGRSTDSDTALCIWVYAIRISKLLGLFKITLAKAFPVMMRSGVSW